MSFDDPISDDIFTALRRIIRTIDVNSRRLALRYGLTGPQLLLLQELARLEEVSVGGLAKNVNLSNGTVTDILDRLEKRGFVQRTRSTTDKRRVLVKITELGTSILRDTPPLLQESFRNEFAQLADWEKTLLLSSLQRIAAMMEISGAKQDVFLDDVTLSGTEPQPLNIMDIPPPLDKE